MSVEPPDAIVFDLGGVLVDWNPRYLYRQFFPGREAEMEIFLAEVCNQAWNVRQDRGRPFADGVTELAARFPEHADLIAVYDARWDEMLAGAIPDTVDLLADLKALGRPLYALSNWSAEKFPVARRRFDFLASFDGIVVSGEVGMIKPEAAILEHLCSTFTLAPQRTVFIDDMAVNVAAASALGFHGLRFRSAARLRGELRALGLL